jgi:hypothetical protein
MQTIYGLINDCGDGSSSIHWYRNKEAVDAVLDEDSPDWDESYNQNEGTPAETLTFPDDLDLAAAGFYFTD